MKITSIQAQKRNPERVNVFVDGKYSFSLTLNQLLQEKLKKDTEIDEIEIKRLIKLSDEGKLKARTLEWLMRRPHSEREFRDYLYRKKAEGEFIEAWIEEFRGKKYLDDDSFARWFSENRMRKNKSTREITSELKGKGISPVTIQNIVSDTMTDVYEKEALEALVNKLRDKPRYSDKTKLIRYLMSKGYRYSDIRRALEDD